jgi:hypothetical protein
MFLVLSFSVVPPVLEYRVYPYAAVQNTGKFTISNCWLSISVHLENANRVFKNDLALVTYFRISIFLCYCGIFVASLIQCVRCSHILQLLQFCALIL